MVMVVVLSVMSAAEFLSRELRKASMVLLKQEIACKSYHDHFTKKEINYDFVFRNIYMLLIVVLLGKNGYYFMVADLVTQSIK